MRVEAVVFDFDELLMPTESVQLACWQNEWAQYGLELDISTFFPAHGHDTTDERYRKLAAAVGPSYDYEISHARRVAYRDALHDTLELCDGMEEWLVQARDARIRCAVATSGDTDWVTGHLARVGRIDAFEVIASGDEVRRRKPAPDVYLLALERLGLDASRAIAVEDTLHGVAAAQDAGLACIAIPNRYADFDSFGQADLVLGSAADMPLHEALARISRNASSP
ncbi:HAD family hydrolase [Streptomyces vinaceus]